MNISFMNISPYVEYRASTSFLYLILLEAMVYLAFFYHFYFLVDRSPPSHGRSHRTSLRSMILILQQAIFLDSCASWNVCVSVQIF